MKPRDPKPIERPIDNPGDTTPTPPGFDENAKSNRQVPEDERAPKKR